MGDWSLLLSHLDYLEEKGFEVDKIRTLLPVGGTPLLVALVGLKKSFLERYHGGDNGFCAVVDQVISSLKVTPPPAVTPPRHRRPRAKLHKRTWREKRPAKIVTNLPVVLPKDFEQERSIYKSKNSKIK